MSVAVRGAWSVAATALLFLSVAAAVRAQSSNALVPGANSASSEPSALVIEGISVSDVFGIGRSVVVRGHATHGVLVFGGDAIIEGRVEGDVAAIGGSVLQREGSYIGGDVVVIGGAYHHGKTAPLRNAASTTVMIAGYEEELREVARNPASLLAPRWSLASFGQRLLAVLFWFIVSLSLTAVAPGAISRAAARLRLTSGRVGLIGFLCAIVLAFGVPASLRFLPTALGAFVLIVALLLLLIAYLFGRTVVHATTGRWLQRVLLPQHQRHSESTALLIGAVFWAVVLSLPYIWPLVVAGLFIASLGLAFTARSQGSWKQPLSRL